MKWTNERITKYSLWGFFGLILSFIIGALTVVLMPFALLYAVGYLIMLLCLFVLHLKNKPDALKVLMDFATDPQVVRDSYVRHNRKLAAKRRKRQIKRSKRRARNLVLIHAANKSIRELMK